MRSIYLVATVALSLVPAPGVVAKLHATDEPQRLFAKCAGADMLGKATDVSWKAQPSQLSEHVALRNHLGAAMPVGTARIMLWSQGTHHTSVRYSVVTVRNAEGMWHTNAVGEEGPGLLPIEPHPMQVLDRALTTEQGKALDQALADPCLYASPTFERDPGIVAGGAVQTLEIDLSGRKWIGSWFGMRTQQEEKIVGLIAQ